MATPLELRSLVKVKVKNELFFHGHVEEIEGDLARVKAKNVANSGWYLLSCLEKIA